MPKKKSKDGKKLLGNHQKSWIWGRHAVTEILEAGRWPIAELYLSDQLDSSELQATSKQAALHGYPIKNAPPERLKELCKSGEHQGYLAKMLEYPYAKLGELEALAQDSGSVIAILDCIQDPYNFGAIIRSAEVLGVSGILISNTNQVGVTSMVARSSAGAVNHLPIAQSSDLVTAAKKLQDAGMHLIAATEKDATSLRDFTFSGPAAIILGNEGEGIRQELLTLADARVTIPQSGKVQSLNVAAAAAILFHAMNVSAL